MNDIQVGQMAASWPTGAIGQAPIWHASLNDCWMGL